MFLPTEVVFSSLLTSALAVEKIIREQPVSKLTPWEETRKGAAILPCLGVPFILGRDPWGLEVFRVDPPLPVSGCPSASVSGPSSAGLTCSLPGSAGR